MFPRDKYNMKKQLHFSVDVQYIKNGPKGNKLKF